MLCLQNVKLENLVHCSTSSIFFTPAESLTLDFKVLSAVPSLHRPTLQRNGLIAKVFLSVSSALPENTSPTNMVRNSCNPPTLQMLSLPFEVSKETLQTLSNRRCLWQNVLFAHNLIEEETLSTGTTRVNKKLTWPVLTEESFAKRVAFLQARSASAEVNSSASCVPIIRVDTMTSILPSSTSSSSSVPPKSHEQHKQNNMSCVKVMMCVVWMPHYDAGLVSWCHTQRRSGERIHEATLIKLAQDLTIGLLALRTLRVGDSVATTNNVTHTATLPTRLNAKLNSCVSKTGRRLISITSSAALQWIPSYLSTLHVLLVSERGDNTSEPPAQFLLSSSMMESPLHQPCPLIHTASNNNNQKNNLANKQRNLNGTIECVNNKEYSNIAHYPFCSPEQLLTLVNNDTGSEVWALGMVVYSLACLFPSPMELTKYIQQREEHHLLPFNHPQLPPHKLVQHIWREMKSLSYSAIVSSVLCQLLSQDYRTRPSLSSMNNTLYDLNRQPIILRFPFALGGFDLIRVTQPRHVLLNAIMGRYVTSDACCVCKRPLNKRKCERRDHASGIASPSWTYSCNSTELLPGLQTRSSMNMCYLYPLLSGINAEEKRKYLRRAIIVHDNDSFCKAHDRSSNVVNNYNSSDNNNNDDKDKDKECESSMSLDVTTLFQLIGGFAIYDWHKSSASNNSCSSNDDKEPRVREVLVPFPAHALRESETPLAVLRVNFTAGLPWPPSCTRQLQETKQHTVNRISNQVPLIFDGVNRLAKWYAWILPGESFTLDNGLIWTPSDDGAFVFWFNENLQPSPLDRYFVMTSVRSSSARYKIPRTVLAESAFRHRLGQDAHYSTFARSCAYSMSRVEAERESNDFTLHRFSALNSLASTVRRRESQQMRLLKMPSSNGIIENENDTCLYDKTNENEESISAMLLQNKITGGDNSGINKSTFEIKKLTMATTTSNNNDAGVLNNDTTTNVNTTKTGRPYKRRETLPMEKHQKGNILANEPEKHLPKWGEEHYYGSNNNNDNEKVKSSNKITTNELNVPLQPVRRRGSKCRMYNITPDQVQEYYPEKETIHNAVNEWQQLTHTYPSPTIRNNNNINQGKNTQYHIYYPNGRTETKNTLTKIVTNGNGNANITLKTTRRMSEQKRSKQLSPLPQLEVEMLQEKANIPKNNLSERHVFENELQQEKEKCLLKNNRVNSFSPTYEPLHHTESKMHEQKNEREKGVQTENSTDNVYFQSTAINNSNNNNNNKTNTTTIAVTDNYTVAGGEEVVSHVAESGQCTNTSLLFAATAPTAVLHEAKNKATTQSKTTIKAERNTPHPFIYANGTLATEETNHTNTKSIPNYCISGSKQSKFESNIVNGKSVSKEHAEFMPLTDQNVEQALENIKAAHERRNYKALQNAHKKNGNQSPEMLESLEREQLLPSQLYELKGALDKHCEWSSNSSNHIIASTSSTPELDKLHEHFIALSISNGTHHVKHTSTNNKNNNDALDVSVEHHVISWTPTLDSAVAPPIIGNMSLFAVYLVGKYYPASVIDAPFTSLTFVIVETGEHGMMQQPMGIDKTLHTALQLPTSAKYLSFLSNAIPLLEHNHFGTLTHTSCDNVFDNTEAIRHRKHILPHHGFAIFDVAGKVIAVLALRVALCSPPLLKQSEFAIPLHGETPQTCETFVVERYMPSFFSVDMPDRRSKYKHNLECITSHEVNMNKLTPCEAENEVNGKCKEHNIDKTHDGAVKSNNVKSEQTTSKDANDRNIDDHDDEIDDMYLGGEDATLHAHVELQQPCWMGFNHFGGQLLFSDESRNYWFPFSIGSRRNAPVVSTHTSLSSVQGCHLINVNNINGIESK